ncbi:hypothetical protein ES703_08134 [subsurface metagenome]
MGQLLGVGNRRMTQIKELGVCPDCEEVFEAEEDYWGWE